MKKRKMKKMKKKWVHHSFKKYNPNFPKWFAQEKNKLKKVLGKIKNAKIEHIGSTAVPGLGGKGIVDIAIFLPRQGIDAAKKKISSQGYKEWPVPKKLNFFSFKKFYGPETSLSKVFHIHITADKKVFEKMFVFRDYLRERPDISEKYAKLKKKASKICKGSFIAYRKLKNPFIKSIIKKAEKN